MAKKMTARVKKLLAASGLKTLAELRRRNAAGSEIIAIIQSLENQAHLAGFHVTGHALNNAKNACGWERAGEIVRAGKAARGERPCR